MQSKTFRNLGICSWVLAIIAGGLTMGEKPPVDPTTWAVFWMLRSLFVLGFLLGTIALIGGFQSRDEGALRHGLVGTLANAVVVVVLIAFVWNRPAQPPANGFAAGNEVMVNNQGKWVHATIFQMQTDRAYVHYKTDNGAYEWISLDRLRQPTNDEWNHP